MKRNKSGISLIVLVITIIVMIILAASVVITLNNTNIINRANEAVNASDLKTVQNIAVLAWSEAYLDKNAGETVNFQERVETALRSNGVSLKKYVVTATETGVEVHEKVFETLGALIKGHEDYGKTVDYTVTVGSETYNEWQVYYEDEENGYVFLALPTTIAGSIEAKAVSELTNGDLELYNIFRLGTNSILKLEDPNYGHQLVAGLISNYGAYANTTDYGTNVVGAIGGPTLELLTTAWNSKGYEPALTYTVSATGYEGMPFSIDTIDTDNIHILSNRDPHWIASPSKIGEAWTVGRTAYLGFMSYDGASADIRPVVCLKSTILAEEGTTTDFSLIK